MASAYSLALGGATVGTGTLLFINGPNAPGVTLKFRRFWVGQSNNMASIQQRVHIQTQISVFPTVVSATPAKLGSGKAASTITGGTAGAAGTCGVTASVEGAGTKAIIWPDAFNVVNGWLLVPTPDEAIEGASGSASGTGFVLPVLPGTLTNWVFGCNWIED